ncbi:MAG: DUF2798 domain-containing protein [Sphingomonadales bacterium]|nr:DUF2798 domain-containing protein [Sphingomonadales bacterium]
MQETDRKREKMTIVLAQGIISCLMALMMTFLFSILPFGFGPGWLGTWIGRWLAAWPVAFGLSLGVGPLSFWLAFRLMHRGARGA